MDGIAGLLRLSPDLELEIVPKFLDDADSSWQEDFFLLALFSQTGRILPHEHIRAGQGARGDLASLVGRTLAQMYWENHRRPIRTYRGRPVTEFSYDGDVDPLDLLIPEPDGFPQTVLQLSRDNEYNAVIAGAVRALLPETQDAETRKQLLRVQQGLALQSPSISAVPRRLPARHRHWQAAYDLSAAVLRGLGVGFAADHLLAPGFLLRTWSTWQSLVEAALRTGLPDRVVLGQQQYPLGQRLEEPLKVRPDVTVLDGKRSVLVVDAKYRTRGDTTPSVNASDIYETLAFLRATACREAVLLYPRRASDGAPQSPGTATVFELVEVGSERVTGMLVECRGISGSGGYEAFSRTLATALRPYLP
ncbi:hypothetical protein ACFDTO_00745 [Microbacteriaceae bacterium 4G12]